MIPLEIYNNYSIVKTINLDQWYNFSTYTESRNWFCKEIMLAYKDTYEFNERILIQHTCGDLYVKQNQVGVITRNLQAIVDNLKISNCFVLMVSTNPNIDTELQILAKNSLSKNPISSVIVNGNWKKTIIDTFPSISKEDYQYGEINPLKISLSELTNNEISLLTQNKVFCMYPWIHLNANPDGQAYPCCMTDHKHSVGNCKESSLAEIWNNEKMRNIRLDMLNGRPVEGCKRCYEQEESGFFSGRLSANKHHGHHIELVSDTNTDGSLDQFKMIYWDIRFSNLCNLRCRSCGHIYSSQWYQDQAKIAGPEWAKNNRVLNYVGKHKTDIWQQLIEHIDYVEQIYFAGGEPLIMDEHYLILEELEKRKKFDVRLIYNTNFTEVKLKNRYVFDYWKKFKSVSVGASLDGYGVYGEYIRKGTSWTTIENNRRKMIEICPNVDFYVSSTMSIMNALHLPDFHKHWVDQGLINPQDWNVNILLDPLHYRIDIATAKYKEKIQEKIQNHLKWLSPQDQLNRATQGYISALTFMNATDNSHQLKTFWSKTQELDIIRKENCLDAIPELQELL